MLACIKALIVRVIIPITVLHIVELWHCDFEDNKQTLFDLDVVLGKPPIFSFGNIAVSLKLFKI